MGDGSEVWRQEERKDTEGKAGGRAQQWWLLPISGWGADGDEGEGEGGDGRPTQPSLPPSGGCSSPGPPSGAHPVPDTPGPAITAAPFHDR